MPPKKCTTEDYIEKVKRIHGDRFSFEKTVYTRAIDPIIITCKKHGDWTTSARSLIAGIGCPICSGGRISHKGTTQPPNLPKGSRYIELTRGMYTIVDEDDFERVSKFKWFCAKLKYAVKNCKKGHYLLHRFILNMPEGSTMFVDHINHNTLDNRKCNLRICTQQENQRNKVKKNTEKTTSVYKGVSLSYIKKNGKTSWRSTINYQCKAIFIGLFKCEIEAAKAYDKKAIELFGDFANPNFKD